jgi:ferredoxin
MPHVVTEPCFNCKYTDCVVVCPCDCFHEGETMLFIDPDPCIDCCACAPECPTEAIFQDDEIPEQWAEYIALNAEMAERSPNITEKQTPLCET